MNTVTERCEGVSLSNPRGILSRLRWSLMILCLSFPGTVGAQTQASVPKRDDCGSPLLGAIYKHSTERHFFKKKEFSEIQQLINSGIALNFKACENGVTPLIEAIVEELPDVAKALVVAGADPNLAADDGVTPLIAACSTCVPELVSFLLERRAAVNASDKYGQSALILAAQQCHGPDIVRMLLKAGANVNMRITTGDTPLTVAAFDGNEEAVKALVMAGADLNVKNSQGQTAVEIARDRRIGRQKSHDRIYQFLLQASRRR